MFLLLRIFHLFGAHTPVRWYKLWGGAIQSGKRDAQRGAVVTGANLVCCVEHKMRPSTVFFLKGVGGAAEVCARCVKTPLTRVPAYRAFALPLSTTTEA